MLKKDPEYFTDFIVAKQNTIWEIKFSPSFSDIEKRKLIEEYEHDISIVQRIQNHFENKRIKDEQRKNIAQIRGYETLISR